MAKYPPRTCRDCGHARWVWSAQRYQPEGELRIIVQHPGVCGAPAELETAAGAGSLRVQLRAMQPHERCVGWQERL